MLILTFISYTVLCILRTCYSISKSSYNYSKLELGIIDSLFLGCYAINSILLGFSIKNQKKLLCFTIIFSGIFTLLTITNDSFINLSVIQSLHGLTQAGGWISCLSLIQEYDNPSAKMLSVWNIHNPLGSIIGKVIGSLIMTKWSTNVIFASYGIFSIIIGFFITLYFLYSKNKDKNNNLSINDKTNNDVKQEKDSTLKKEYIDVNWWNIDGLIEYSICFFFMKFTVYSLTSWLPNYINSLGQYNSSISSLISSLFDVGMIIGGFITGILKDRWSNPALLSCFGLLFSIPCLLCYSFLGDKGIEYQIIFIIILGVSINSSYLLVSTCSSVDLSNKYPSKKGTIVGIINGFGGLGATLQGIVIGLIEDWSLVYYLLICCTVISLISISRKIYQEIYIIYYKNKSLNLTDNKISVKI